MEDYPSLAEGNGLENRQVGQTTREFESLILRIDTMGVARGVFLRPQLLFKSGR